jgi:hypothetical protein
MMPLLFFYVSTFMPRLAYSRSVVCSYLWDKYFLLGNNGIDNFK